MTNKLQEASKSSGELFLSAYTHAGVNEGFVLSHSLFPYIVMDLLPKREGLVVRRGRVDAQLCSQNQLYQHGINSYPAGHGH